MQGRRDKKPDDDFREEGLDSDYEEDRGKRIRRKRKNQGDEGKPKIIDETYMAVTKKKLRACTGCLLVLNQEKWVKLDGCPNCSSHHQGVLDTTDCFESLIAIIFPKVSWVAKW